jgi:hypothetical protein
MWQLKVKRNVWDDAQRSADCHHQFERGAREDGRGAIEASGQACRGSGGGGSMPGETGSVTEGPEISKGPPTDLKDTIKERGDAPGDEERAGEASQRAQAGGGAGGGRVRDV